MEEATSPEEIIHLKPSRFFLFRDLFFAELIFAAVFSSAYVDFLPSSPLTPFLVRGQEGFLTFFVLLLLNFVLLVYIVLSWRAENYSISAESLIHTKGLFFRERDNSSLHSIETISVKQDLLGIIFRYGNIRLYSPFSEDPLRIKRVPHPLENATRIEKLIPRDIPIQHSRKMLLGAKEAA